MTIRTLPGDRTADYPPGSYVGADSKGRFYRPVATYDTETDCTTVEYVEIPAAEMRAYAEPHMEQVYQKAELIELFGGHF